MGAACCGFLFDSASIFHDDAPRIIPGLSIGSNRRALDRELCHRTQPMLVRLTEDLILREVEAIQIVLHSAENEGEKSRGEIRCDTNGLVASTVGVILQHNTNARVGTDTIRLLLALGMHMSIVLDRCRLELVRKLAELLIGHVDRDLVLNAIIFHFQVSSLSSHA